MDGQRISCSDFIFFLERKRNEVNKEGEDKKGKKRKETRRKKGKVPQLNSRNFQIDQREDPHHKLGHTLFLLMKDTNSEIAINKEDEKEKRKKKREKK